MDVPDVLRQIAYRLDDQSLFSLPQSLELRRDMSKLLQDNSFWHQRAEHLTSKQIDYNPNLDWRQMYYGLLSIENSKSFDPDKKPIDIFDPVFKYTLENIDFLKLVIELYGPIAKRTSMWNSAWFDVKSADVFEYLFSIDQISYSSSNSFASHLTVAVANGNIDLIRTIDKIAKQKRVEIPSRDLWRPLTLSAQIGDLPVTLLLLEMLRQRGDNTSHLIGILSTAVEKDRIEYALEVVSEFDLDSNQIRQAIALNLTSISQEMLEALMNTQPSQRDLDSIGTYLLSISVSNSRFDLATWLLDTYPSLSLNQYALRSYVQEGSSPKIAFVLKYVSPAVKNNTILQEAAISHLSVFKTVLSDQRLDPMIELFKVVVNTWRLTHGRTGLRLQATGTINKKRTKETADEVKMATSLSIYHYGLGQINLDWSPGPRTKDEAWTALLISDKRVRVEQLDLFSLRAFAWNLTATIHDRVSGFIYACSLVKTTISYERLGQRIEGASLYSITLRYIILKRPSNSELLDWMIEQNKPAFQLAGSNILDNEIASDVSIPFYALLTTLLYPKLGLSDLISELVDEPDLADAVGLVGAQLGYQQLVSRSKVVRSNCC